MRFPPLPRRRPDLRVATGERLLAWAATPEGGVVGGTRAALYLPGREPSRLPWEEVATAEWDPDEELLRVVEVGRFGEPRPEHALRLVEPGHLLPLVRERVSASIVLQRHVPVRNGRGVRILARRSPGTHDPIGWFVEYDAGLDPASPEVQAVVDGALAAARADVGE